MLRLSGYLLMSSFASRRFSNGWRNGFVEGASEHFRCLIFSPQGVENARFGLIIFEPRFILNRSVFPLQRLLQVVIVVQAPLCRFVVSRPRKSADAPQFILDALQ